MTENPTHTDRQKALREATFSLLEKLLVDPDETGVEEAAQELGMWADGEVRAGQEDELGALLDYYLFDIEHEGSTRIAAFVATPPEGLSDDELLVLSGLAEARFAVFKVERHQEDVTSLVAVFEGDPASVYDPEFPITSHGATVATRVFTADGVGLHTGNAMRMRRRQAKFIVDEEAVYDLAKVLDGHEGMAFDSLSHRVLLRAIIAVRAAQGVIGEGEYAIVSQPRREKRSLGRRARGRKKR